MSEPRELARTLRLRHVTMISIGGIIGAGLFVGSSAAIAAAGPAVIASYALAGLLAVLVMRMLAEMAVALPEVRSFTEFSRAGLGDAAGFVAGWLYWYFWVVVVPVEAIAGAAIVETWTGLPAWALGVALMAVMTGVNLTSARSYGEFEFWFASIKVAAIVAFIAVALGSLAGLTPHPAASVSNLSAHGGFFAQGLPAVLIGTTTVFFSLTGAEVTLIAAAESSAPGAAVARLTTSVVFRILTFYVGSLVLILTVVPWTQVVPGTSPFTHALEAMGLPGGGFVMSVVILTAVLSCLNSAFYICSRVLFVLADRGDAPRALVALNRRLVPTRSVWLSALVGLAGVLVATSAPGAVFGFLVSSSGTVIVFVYLMTAVSHVRLRQARERRGEPTRGPSMWLFPWASYAAIASMAAILVALALSPKHASELWLSTLALAVVVALERATRASRRGSAGAGRAVRGAG